MFIDEDVENHLAEEDSEEDASLLSKPKRQKLDDGQSKEYQEQSKSIKQHVDNAEKIVSFLVECYHLLLENTLFIL